MAKRFKDDAVLVIGLGRFGGALAETLEHLGHEVMAVEPNSELVQTWAGKLTHVVSADATNIDAMRQIGAHEFNLAVVAIGTDIEASVLATSVLADLQVGEIWAKAITAPHGRILERIGASHVVFPERDAGTRVARLLTGELIDFFEVDPGYAMAKLRAPKSFAGKTVSECNIRTDYGVAIVGRREPSSQFAVVDKTTELHQGDILLVAGPNENVQRFATDAE